ncbi:MAG: metallopeptidase family protein [Planctomycetota bacterium]|nr:metallopeptidase family protein [Planctomycetota bacterium]
MDSELRDYFDEQLQRVLNELPQRVHDLLDRMPLHVEDYPSQQVMAEMGIRYRDALCGLYTGVPISDRSASHPPILPDVVTIYREGILNLATNHRGTIDPVELQRQMRITVLHELGHHHGMDEDELTELGYG